MDPRQHLDKICTEVEGMSLSVPNPKNQHWSSATGHKARSSFKESPVKQLKSGARLRLGLGSADEIRTKSRKNLNFCSSSPTRISSTTNSFVRSKTQTLREQNKEKVEQNQSEKAEQRDEKGKMEQILRCEKCDIQSTSKRKLERHRRLCHETSTNKPGTSSYRCFQCRKSFNQFAKLLIHKYSHPVSGVKFGNVCNLCRTRFHDIKKHHQEAHISSSSQHDNSSKTKVVNIKETLI